MVRNEKFEKTVTVKGPGMFILDFSDWNDTARVEVALNVDGEDWFRGSGSSKNIHDWTSDWGTYSARVKQTDDREIAFLLD
jgi:hypothetical protein